MRKTLKIVKSINELDTPKNKSIGFLNAMGASSKSKEKRQEEDFYATDPIALTALLPHVKFKNVWECACGAGDSSEVLKKAGIHGKSTDLINRGYSKSKIDFLSPLIQEWNGDILTNPPYSLAQEFIEKALSIIPKGRKVAMLLRIQFLESKKRKDFFDKYPPKIMYVSRSRISCAMNRDFEKYKKGKTICFCWFIWEKGFKGTTQIKHFN